MLSSAALLAEARSLTSAVSSWSVVEHPEVGGWYLVREPYVKGDTMEDDGDYASIVSYDVKDVDVDPSLLPEPRAYNETPRVTCELHILLHPTYRSPHLYMTLSPSTSNPPTFKGDAEAHLCLTYHPLTDEPCYYLSGCMYDPSSSSSIGGKGNFVGYVYRCLVAVGGPVWGREEARDIWVRVGGGDGEGKEEDYLNIEAASCF